MDNIFADELGMPSRRKRDDYKSRKLFMMLVLLTLSTVFVIIGKAEFSEWANLMEWLYITYVFGNVGAKFLAQFILAKQGADISGISSFNTSETEKKRQKKVQKEQEE